MSIPCHLRPGSRRSLDGSEPSVGGVFHGRGGAVQHRTESAGKRHRQRTASHLIVLIIASRSYNSKTREQGSEGDRQKGRERKEWREWGSEIHFLFVLMWPTCPQLAHFRCVPIGPDGSAAGEATEGDAAAPGEAPTAFSFEPAGALLPSRTFRRPKFLSSLSSSSSILPNS